MATAKFKELWKNDYFQTVVMTALMLMIVFGFWYGSQLALATQYPALAVVSTSMLPTLNVGDVIIVQGVSAAQINANYTTGDVIVYRSLYDPDKLIVHRAVSIEFEDNSYWITTKGDNNVGPDSPFNESRLIGKVIGRVPIVGNFVLFINALGNFYFAIVIVVIIINIALSFLFDNGEKPVAEKPREKRKLFGKIDIELILFTILNLLLIGFAVFSLIGSFTFWQNGAEPPQNVTVHGMSADLQFHESFNRSYNNISGTFLSQGFLTYKIDSLVNGAVRFGVPTFSWMQASILILLSFDVWMLIKFLHLDEKLKGKKTEVSSDQKTEAISES